MIGSQLINQYQSKITVDFQMRITSFKLLNQMSYALRSPLNLDLLKSPQGKAVLKNSLKARFRKEELLSQVETAYENYRRKLQIYEQISQEVNAANKQLGQNYKSRKIDQASSLKLAIGLIKDEQARTEKKLMEAKLNAEASLLKIGNIVQSEVIISRDEKNNKIVKDQLHAQDSLNKSATSYEQLNQMFKIADLKRGQKVSGHRGYFLNGTGLKLALALASYGTQFLQKRGYACFQTPAIILEDVLRESCQLQTVDTDMYKISGENKYLIATSEQSLAGFYRGETLENKELPIRMGGYSSCFRKQAGAAGKDIHGLFRVHQFEKIEQFILCKPQDSAAELQRMMQTSCSFYSSLGIPFRVVDIVSGELNDSAVRKYDLEGWYPSQKRFRQLVSVSNCTDYQSRLLEVKYRQGSDTRYVHMLNGTLVAIQRSITCILENIFDSDRQVLIIPQKLRQYVGVDELRVK